MSLDAVCRSFRAVSFGAWALLAGASQGLAGGLTLAHPFPPDGTIDRWARDIAECADRQVGIPVEIVSSSRSVADGMDVLKALQAGQVDIAILSAASVSDLWRPIGLLTVPGALQSFDQIDRISSSREFLDVLDRAGAAERGVNVLGVGWDYLVLATTERASGGDLHGLKIRPSGEGSRRFFEMAGASTMYIPGAEAIYALAFGAVDGAVISAEMTPELISKGDPIVARWSDDFTPFTVPLVALLSDNAARGWGEDLLARLREGCGDATRTFNRTAFETAREAIQRAASQGIEIRPYDAAKWSDATADAYKSAVGELEAGAIAEALDRVRQ